MKLGTRITLTTTVLVMVALTVYGVLTVRLRQNELTTDLERQTQTVGTTLRVALEAALQEGLYEDVRHLVARIQAAEPPVGIAYLEQRGAPGSGFAPPTVRPATDNAEDEDTITPPPPDPTRDARLRRILISGAPYGEHVEVNGRPTYALAIPLFNNEHQVVAAIDLTHDGTLAARELSTTRREVAAAVLGVGLGLALMVWLTTRRGISHPLKRLVEGIDEVAVGDLTRVILRERDDEIGDLAERFNEMTTSLREARAETQRGVEAKLALEARLRHSEKLATIGQLAASIAHEVGTPLNVIGGRARTMEKKAAAGDLEGASKNAEIIAAQAARITKIIQQLLDYSRKKAAVREPVDLASVVKDTLDFLEGQTAAAQVVTAVAPFRADEGDGVPASAVALGDPDQLQQVCINLCINAIQAMPTGGKLDIGTSALVRRKPGLDVAPPGRYVLLEVGDNGIGIPPEDRERIFEPFYSTKQDGGGTGLGLAVSQGIVKDHDGWIEIEGRPEGGTLFRVFLPAPDEKEA